jgi:hypothetical protein
LYQALQQAVRRWNERAGRGGGAVDLEGARRFIAQYARLGEAFDHIAAAVRDAEQLGLPVEGTERFEEVRSELRALLNVPLERMVSAEEHFWAGRGRPLGEVRDELRRRAGA